MGALALIGGGASGAPSAATANATANLNLQDRRINTRRNSKLCCPHLREGLGFDLAYSLARQ
jgi:hypothetical protein